MIGEYTHIVDTLGNVDMGELPPCNVLREHLVKATNDVIMHSFT